MSADNYVEVDQFEDGWRWAMGFASNELDYLPDDEFKYGPFPSCEAAMWNAEKSCHVIEYGIQLRRKPEPEKASPHDVAIGKLKEVVERRFADPCVGHREIEKAIMEYFDIVAPEISAAWRRCRDRCGF